MPCWRNSTVPGAFASHLDTILRALRCQCKEVLSQAVANSCNIPAPMNTQTWWFIIYKIIGYKSRKRSICSKCISIILFLFIVHSFQQAQFGHRSLQGCPLGSQFGAPYKVVHPRKHVHHSTQWPLISIYIVIRN